MIYKVELKYLGRTVHSFQKEMTPEEMEEAKQRALDKLAKNYFTRNMAFDVVVTEP